MTSPRERLEHEQDFQAVHYRDRDGGEPVRDFLAGLDDEVHAVLANQVDRLNMLNDEVAHLPFPTAPR